MHRLKTLHRIAKSLHYTVHLRQQPITDVPDVQEDEDIWGYINYTHNNPYILLYENEDLILTFSHEIGHALCDKVMSMRYHNLSTQTKERMADIVGNILLFTLNIIPHKYN
jgi:Zn-dependent peptidase ImmA (M78 family)